MGNICGHLCRACLLTASIVTTLSAADPISELAEFANQNADATKALQAAVDHSSGAVVLPDGVFQLSRPIEINLEKTGYRSIVAHGTTKLVMNGAGPALRIRGSHFKSADPGGFSDLTWKLERMPLVDGLAIEGNHAEADGIAAIGTMQLTISRTHLRKLRHGVRLIENNRNVIIESCHIYENHGVGIFYDNVNLHQSNIVGSHISYCAQGGIVSRKGNVRNIHITGCDIESNMSPDTAPTANVFIDCRDSKYGTAEVAITGCTIQHNDKGPQSTNIRIIGGTLGPDANPNQQEGHVTITGNVLSDVHTNIWLESCRGVTVLGNTFWMGFEHNLLVEKSSHIIVGPNNFDRNPRYNYGRSLEAKNGLHFIDSNDCTLTGMHISRVQDSPAAVTMKRCDRFHVSGLTILDCELGFHLEEVTRSRFADCMIQSEQAPVPAKLLEIKCGLNSFDSSLRP